MRDFDYLTTFILNNDYSKEKIDELKEYLSLKNNKQLIKEAFKFLNTNIGVIENTDFFNEIIPNTVDFIALLCDQEIFNEEQVLVNINRIKKTREALLGNANKYSNDIWLEAANKLDEIILDKKMDVEDLKKLLLELINRNEDINIIKKFLKVNKAVILVNDNELFDYIFNLAINSLQNNSPSIYYYISLLKIFYSSKIDKTKYVKLLNSVSDDTNEFANEIYYIIYGIRRSLKPDEVLNKYGMITNFVQSSIILPKSVSNTDELIAIDSDGAKVRDDALSIKKDGNKYIIGIHIADPSLSFDKDSILYNQALNNFKNIYFSRGNTSIFPSSVEKRFSLDKNKIRNAISLYVVLNDSGDIIDYYLNHNEIKVCESFDYSECDMIMNQQRYLELSKKLNDLFYIASALENKNKGKKEYWDKKNSDKDISQYNHNSDKIVREFMNLYGYLTANIMKDNNSPYIYRTQDSSYFDSLIAKLNIKIDYDIKEVIDSIYLVSKYSQTPEYHYGLKLPMYSHSTCPLRRFPDLYNEFLIHNFYFKDKLFDFNKEEFIELINYSNQRNSELSLMRSEYNRALKLVKRN